MITVSKARKILGKTSAKLPDDYVEKLLSQMYQIAEVMFEHFGFIKDPDIDNTLENTKLKLESH